jgi:hypothetical protein
LQPLVATRAAAASKPRVMLELFFINRSHSGIAPGDNPAAAGKIPPNFVEIAKRRNASNSAEMNSIQ